MQKKGQALEILFTLGIISVIIIIFLFWALAIVQYNEYAFEKEFGNLKMGLRDSGLTYVGIGTLVRVNNQINSYNIKVDAATKDMQQVAFDVNLNIQIKKDEAYNYLKDYPDQKTYIEYLNNKIQEKSKTIIFKYNAGEILSNRLVISDEINKAIQGMPELKYFQIHDIALSNIDFSAEYDAILERKAQVDIEREIIIKQKENLALQKQNIEIVDIETYFKYQLIEKWDGKADLIISDALIRKGE